MEDLPVLCDSKMSKPMPKYVFVMAIAFGIIFLSTALKGFVSGERILKVLYNLAFSAICLYGATISKKLYISDVGVVREMKALGRHVRRVLPWSDVKFVTLVFRRAEMMVFFEEDVTGWKVLFSRDQEAQIRDILEEYIPDIEVKEMQKQ